MYKPGNRQGAKLMTKTFPRTPMARANSWTVVHYNFGTHYHFDVVEAAKAFILKAGFCATLYFDGKLVNSYDTINGWAS